MEKDINQASANGEGSIGEDELIPVDKRVKVSREIAKWFFGISIAFMALTFIVSLGSGSNKISAVDEFLASQSNTSNTPDTSSWDSSWVPSGFTAWSTDSNVAWKWVDKSNCDNYSCVTAEFVSRDGCPNGLYAAINWLDSNDAVVSYDNATLPSLLAMQTAKLRFDDVLELGKSGQIAEISCR